MVKKRVYPEGYFVSRWMVICMIVGAAIGVALNDFAVSVAVGVAVGLAIGTSKEEDMEKAGFVRELTSKEVSIRKRNIWITAGVLFLLLFLAIVFFSGIVLKL